jgi:hypothetical protein
METVVSCSERGSSYGIDIAGDYAYTATYIYPCAAPHGEGAHRAAPRVDGARPNIRTNGPSDCGLKIYDIGNPAEPALVGYYDTPDYAEAVAVWGERAYLGADDHLYTFDVSDPLNVEDMVIAGFRLFCGSGVLTFFDLPDAPPVAAPTEVAGVGSVTCLDAAGEYVYVGVFSPEPAVFIVESYNPNSVVGSCTPWGTSGYFWDLVVYGHYVYVVDHNDIYVIDASDPADPVDLGYAWTPGDPVSLAISGHYLFVVTTWDTYTLVYDLSDPENPTLIGQKEYFGGMHRIAVSGDYLYGSDFYGFKSVQVFQRRFDRERNAVRSTVIAHSDEEIIKVKLATAQSDSILWEVSADSGLHWEGIVPGDDWRAHPFRHGSDRGAGAPPDAVPEPSQSVQSLDDDTVLPSRGMRRHAQNIRRVGAIDRASPRGGAPAEGAAPRRVERDRCRRPRLFVGCLSLHTPGRQGDDRAEDGIAQVSALLLFFLMKRTVITSSCRSLSVPLPRAASPIPRRRDGSSRDR